MRRVLLSVLFSTATLVAQQAPRPGLTVEQALLLRQLANPQLGDGFLACTVVTPRPLADGAGGPYLHAAVIDDLAAALRGEGRLRFLVQGRDSAPGLAARPNAREISFLRAVDGAMQLFRLPLTGGEPERVATTASIAAYQWRPDGQAFAYTTLDPLPPARQQAQQAGIKPVVVDEDWRHLSLWLWENGAEPRRLTEGVTVFHFAWAPNGKQLAVATAPHNLVDDSYMFQQIQLCAADKGGLRPLFENRGKLGEFAWSPDGARLAVIAAADRNDPHAGALYLVDTDTRKTTPIEPGQERMVQHVAWQEDHMLCLDSVSTRTQLRLRAPDGGNVADGDFELPGTAITALQYRGELVAFTASTAKHPAELFLLPLHDHVLHAAKAVRLSDSNPALADVTLGEQTVETITARDGLDIQGMLIKPVGYEAGRRYPLVIVAHGGPESHFQNGWLSSYSNWGQLLAARGYMSWYPNYRASTGRGTRFAKLDHGDPMGAEFADHLDAIAWFDRLGLIDPRRVGVGGGSYGGYTAAWAATRHSAQFACAVSFVPFVHIPTKWLCTDIPYEFYYVHYQEQWPWQQPGLLSDRSPLTWAGQCRTPLLLLGGTADPRVHPSQPLMLYRAVKFGTDTPVRLVQYPGEGHGNRSNVNQYDYALRTLRWFDWYLQPEGDQRKKPLPPLDLDYPALK